MKPLFKTLLVTSLIAAAGFAGIAQAQDAPAAPAPATTTAQSAPAAEHHDHWHKMSPEKMRAVMAKHMAALKTKLKISPAQEGAWTTFTTAMQPGDMMDHKRPDLAELDKLTTPERIDKMRTLRTQRMADMQAAMDKRDDAIKTLYAVLSPEQQKVFDTEHARMARNHGQEHGKHGDWDKCMGK